MFRWSRAQTHQSAYVSSIRPRPISDWKPAVATPHWKSFGKSRAAALAGRASASAKVTGSAGTIAEANVNGMPRFSVLALSRVPAGEPEAQALRNTLDLARHAEALGFHRYWLAEH